MSDDSKFEPTYFGDPIDPQVPEPLTDDVIPITEPDLVADVALEGDVSLGENPIEEGVESIPAAQTAIDDDVFVPAEVTVAADSSETGIESSSQVDAAADIVADEVIPVPIDFALPDAITPEANVDLASTASANVPLAEDGSLDEGSAPDVKLDQKPNPLINFVRQKPWVALGSVVVVIAFVGLLIFLLLPKNENKIIADLEIRQVEYTVSIDYGQATVAWGTSASLSNEVASGNWSQTLPVNGDNGLVVTVVGDVREGDKQKLECEIKVNGKSISKESGTGTVNCSGASI